MEGDFVERREQERRNGYGALMLACFATTRRPLSFQDLVSVVGPQGAHLSEVADWLATARQSGMLEDMGFETGRDGSPVGPRLFRLADSARAAIKVERRRRSDRRSGA